MSLTASSWAWATMGLAAGPKLVLLALADHADDDGACWPSQDRLVERTGLARATVQRSIDTLAADGLIERDPGSGRRSTRYRLRIEGPHHEAPTDIHRGLATRPLDGSSSLTTRPLPPQDEAPGASPRARSSLTTRPEPPEPSLNHHQPARAHAPDVTARIEQIARRAGELHINQNPAGIRNPQAVSTARATRLLTERHELLKELAATDLPIDTLALAALDGRMPEDPSKGIFLSGSGYVPRVGFAAS